MGVLDALGGSQVVQRINGLALRICMLLVRTTQYQVSVGIVLSDMIGAMPEAGFVDDAGHIKTTGSGTHKSSGLGA